ncbi:aminoglycoside N(3)-acetyltransferase [Aerosakkonemataceae cyanobacterium BLCC-F154]|uniref:Aminoglycoside N(3)-acetyltransferase n=1 Tax=Floridaenema fluviatile BLCC-F154 TaxID=3153640 RepID=A0ABV4YFM1_9CYAN
MSESEAIAKTPSPRTLETLKNDFRQLGLQPEMTIIVHSSLSSLGWVCGGSVTVIQALMDIITPNGTIVMPAHSGDYTDPATWENPPVPSDWWSIIRENMPAFDPQITPTRAIGKIAENFRIFPQVLRSYHPVVSFAAWGKHAENIIKNHSLDYSLGESSPLARLYDLYGWVLLLGVSYDSCTCLHLAEYRVPQPQEVQRGTVIVENNQPVWKNYQDVEFNDDSFNQIGAAFEQTQAVKIAPVGSAEARFFPVKLAVDFAVDWLNNKLSC